ncbi:neurotensin receptor type 1-like isoform X1 [Ischnura elegans]|uniref:neurotensin receptor type 1-like isoform X1 n=1 Tax=Ischnura elegans TaxID=197161 RepID=UPI001ED86DC6|nr:neurotensin receptor type 1-like isoform X1 [Ischnura elegans]
MISALVTISIATSETARCCTYGEADAAAPSPVRGPPSATGGGDGEGAEDGECPGGGCPGGSALSYGSAAAAFAPATPAPPPPLPAEEGTQTPRQYTVAGSEDGVAVAAATPSAADGSSVVEGHAPPERDTWDSFPPYIKTTSTLLCAIILGVGVAGNVMVPLVILRSRDMRNSTNVFLVNLSVADLLVLLLCTPTLLVEVHSRPEVWVLGPHMCKAVPFVELTVAHASVLTILAISFERYYAICEPLKAGYVCTKGRAFLLCLLSWAVAAVFTSPVLAVSQYEEETEYYDGTLVPVCFMVADTFWPAAYFLLIISIFFLLPFVVLVVLYSVIARHLMAAPGITISSSSAPALIPRIPRSRQDSVSSAAECQSGCGGGEDSTTNPQAPPPPQSSRRSRDAGGRRHHYRGTANSANSSCSTSTNYRHRRQVVVMLGTVVASFFVCLTPFRVLTVMVITMETGAYGLFGQEAFYCILLASRLLIYLHSALNPCLYNLMSSKFRRGFGRLFCCECCRGGGRRARRNKRRLRQSLMGGSSDWWSRRGGREGIASSFTSRGGADDGDARASEYATYSSGSFSSTWTFGRRGGVQTSSTMSSSSSGKRRRHRSSTTSSSLGSFNKGNHRRAESFGGPPPSSKMNNSPELVVTEAGQGNNSRSYSQEKQSVSRTSSLANGRQGWEVSKWAVLRREESYV